MLLEHAGEVVSREEIRKKLLDLDPAAGQELRTAGLSRRQ
jgi:DNA-binding winged helix-turn-helix (wHTH) protein